jgi:hypothetical protein
LERSTNVQPTPASCAPFDSQARVHHLILAGVHHPIRRHSHHKNGPFEIPYRVMVPQAHQATNLLVTCAVSSSHVGSGLCAASALISPRGRVTLGLSLIGTMHSLCLTDCAHICVCGDVCVCVCACMEMGMGGLLLCQSIAILFALKKHLSWWNRAGPLRLEPQHVRTLGWAALRDRAHLPEPG